MSILAAGDSTYKIGMKEYETGVSQVFLCIYPEIFRDQELREKLLNEIIDFTHNVAPMNPGEKTYYPGERTLRNRKSNLKNGIEVNEQILNRVLEMSGR